MFIRISLIAWFLLLAVTISPVNAQDQPKKPRPVSQAPT
jgi:hypothetical protein